MSADPVGTHAGLSPGQSPTVLELAVRIRGRIRMRHEIIGIEAREPIWRGRCCNLRGLLRSWEIPVHKLSADGDVFVGNVAVRRKWFTFSIDVTDAEGREVLRIKTNARDHPIDVLHVDDRWSVRERRGDKEKPWPFDIGHAGSAVALLWCSCELKPRSFFDVWSCYISGRLDVYDAAKADTVALMAIALAHSYDCSAH